MLSIKGKLKLIRIHSPFEEFQNYPELLQLMINIEYSKIYHPAIVFMFFWIEILFGTIERDTEPYNIMQQVYPV